MILIFPSLIRKKQKVPDSRFHGHFGQRLTTSKMSGLYKKATDGPWGAPP